MLDREGLTQHMGIGLDLLNQVIVPERVVVSCDARPITVSEVFAAIRRDLESRRVAAANFSLEDLTFQSQVYSKFADAQLHIVRSEFDEPLKRARFVLTSGDGSAGLPFVVTAQLGAGSESASLRNATEPKQLDVYSRTAGPSRKAEILVAAGKQARLVLRSASIEMVEDVVPLERGVLGQQIRVQMLDTGKISKARVDGPSHLESTF